MLLAKACPRVEDALGRKEVDLGEEAVRSLRTGRRLGARLCVSANDCRGFKPYPAASVPCCHADDAPLSPSEAFRSSSEVSLCALSIPVKVPSDTGVSSFIFPVSYTRGGGCWSPSVPVASC